MLNQRLVDTILNNFLNQKLNLNLKFRNVQENLNKYSNENNSNKFLDISSINSTIQAGDTSIMNNNHYLNYKSSKDLISSLKSNHYSNEINEFKAKCLNDLTYLNQSKSMNTTNTIKQSRSKFTHVDILVPSGLTSTSKQFKSNPSIDKYSSNLGNNNIKLIYLNTCIY